MSTQKHKYTYPYDTKINLLRNSITPIALTQPSPFYARPTICPLSDYLTELYNWILTEFQAQKADYTERYETVPITRDYFSGGSDSPVLPPKLFTYYCCYPRELANSSGFNTNNVIKTQHNTKYSKHDNGYTNSLIAYKVDYSLGGQIPSSCFSHILSYTNDIKTAYTSFLLQSGPTSHILGSQLNNGYEYPFLYFVQDICGLKSTNIFGTGYGSFGYGGVIPYYGDLQKISKNEQYLDSFLNAARPTYPGFVITGDGSLLFLDLLMAKAYGETTNNTIQGRLVLLDYTNRVVDNVLFSTNSCSSIAGTRFKNTQYAFLCSGSRQASLSGGSGSQSNKVIVTNYQLQPIYESKYFDIKKLITARIQYYNPTDPDTFQLIPQVYMHFTMEYINNDGYYCTYDSLNDQTTTYNNTTVRPGIHTTELLIADGNSLEPYKPQSGYGDIGGYYSSPIISGGTYQFSFNNQVTELSGNVTSEPIKGNLIQLYGLQSASNLITNAFFYLSQTGSVATLYSMDSFSTQIFPYPAGNGPNYPQFMTSLPKVNDNDYNVKKQNFIPYNTKSIARITNEYIDVTPNLTFCLEPNYIIDTGRITVKKQYLPETACIYWDWKGYAEPEPNNYEASISTIFTSVQSSADYGFIELLLDNSTQINTRQYGPNQFALDDAALADSNVLVDGNPSNQSYNVGIGDYSQHNLKIAHKFTEITASYGSEEYNTALEKQRDLQRFLPTNIYKVRNWTKTLPKNITFRYNSSGALVSPIKNTYMKMILEPHDQWNIWISDTTALSIEGYESYNQDKNGFAEPFNITKGEILLYGKKVGNVSLRIQEPKTELNVQPKSYGTFIDYTISVWDVKGFPDSTTAKKGSSINVGIEGISIGPHKWTSSDPNIARIADDPQNRTNDTKKRIEFIGSGSVFFWVSDQADIPWVSKIYNVN